MNILLLSNMYPSKKYPHYGVFVKNTASVLEQIPNVKLDTVVLTKHDGKVSKLFGYLRFYASILLRGIFGKYDIIYGHFLSHIAMPLRIVMSLRPRIKLILNAHGNDVIADRPQDEKWVNLSKTIAPYADHIIVPSQYFKDLLIREFQYPEEKLFVYPSGGVDLTVFHPQDRDKSIRQYGLDPQKKYIGYISRIEADKGWDTFLHTVSALKDDDRFGFIVVGDGAEREAFDELALSLGIHDRLVRFSLLSQPEIATLFSLLDVFCFPTRRKSESLGLVGLEAMACGCPVVACRAGGPSSYIEDGLNGFLVDTAQEIADRILKIENMSPDETEALHEAMGTTVHSYSRQVLNSSLINFFSQL